MSYVLTLPSINSLKTVAIYHVQYQLKTSNQMSWFFKYFKGAYFMTNIEQLKLISMKNNKELLEMMDMFME